MLSGKQGEIVDCGLHVATLTQATSPATLLEMTLVFDSSKAEVDSFESCGPLDPPFNLPCTPAGGECNLFGDPTIFCDSALLTCSQCVVWDPASPDAELATGHALVTCAQPPDNCGTGEFALLFWSSESKPLSQAYLSGGLVQGHSELVNVRFALTAEALSGTPVTGAEILAVDAFANSVQVGVYHPAPPNPSHIIVTGGP